MPVENKAIDAGTFSTIKHDIKNHLSNIMLLIEQLRHETPDSPDYIANLDLLAVSATKIDSILKSTD